MTKKKDLHTPISQEEHIQAQKLFEHYQQIAHNLHASKDQQQVEAALAEVTALSAGAQMALLEELSNAKQVEAADVLVALNEFATLKEVRKEARRSLIRLEGAKIYPNWEAPIEPDLVSDTLQVSTNPPRFWKGFVTDSLDSGEVQLMLAWQQGEDYKEVRLLGFLLDFWRDGVKDFFVQMESKRSFENLYTQIRLHSPDVKLKDCSLVEGRRLLREALAMNKLHGTKPHRDYQMHLSLVNQLILEASGLEEEAALEAEEEINLSGLEPTEVIANFVEFWTDGDYDLAYQLLAHDSPLREGLSEEQWVERRDAWADTFYPDELEPGLLQEHAAPKSKLWLPNPFSKTPATTTKEVEVGWSIEMEKTPLDEKLPELPEATAIYDETGRHWFWSSYTLVQENNEWRIQNMTDEGAKARNLSTEELYQQIEKFGNEVDKLTQKVENLKVMSDEEALNSIVGVARYCEQIVYYVDALIKKSPMDREAYENAAGLTATVGQFERCLVYLMPILKLFPAEQAETYRRIGIAQRMLSQQFLDGDDDERCEQFEKLAEESLTASLALEESLEAHISLAELLIDENERLDEAKNHLLMAKNLITEPDDEAHIELHLGEIAMEQEQFQEALHHYQRVTELKPDEADSWYDLGQAQQELEQFQEAETSYKRAIVLEPENIGYYSTLGLMYKGNKQDAQASQILDEGLRANPDSAELHAYRAVMYMQSGDQHQAYLFLDKAEELDPELDLIPTYRQMFKQYKAALHAAPHNPPRLTGQKKKRK